MVIGYASLMLLINNCYYVLYKNFKNYLFSHNFSKKCHLLFKKIYILDTRLLWVILMKKVLKFFYD